MRFFVLYFSLLFTQLCVAQVFTSSDTALVGAFNRSKHLALSYKGNCNDRVGCWYEAALPGRDAFCMRDVSHQCIGAEILGMSRENKNMFYKFVSNIALSRDWCSYWEIDKLNQPAPTDYKNDSEFWYNLPANFDVVYACERLYRWTGDKTYVSDPVYLNFYQKTLNEYLTRWNLQVDSLLTRSSLKNLKLPLDKNNMFLVARGLASYNESRADVRVGADLVASIYRAMVSYASIAGYNGNDAEQNKYISLADVYRQHFDSLWWNPGRQMFYAAYTFGNKFISGKENVFLFWFDIVRNIEKRKKILEIMTADAHQLNVESQSYLPLIFYQNGRYDSGYRQLLYLSNPSTKRHEYPEVSYAVIEGIVKGLMGVDPDAGNHTIETLYRGPLSHFVKIKDLPFAGATIDLYQKGNTETELFNNSNTEIIWKPRFIGKFAWLKVNNKKVLPSYAQNENGTVITCFSTKIKPYSKIKVITVKK